MNRKFHRLAQAILLVSLMAASTQASAQQTRQRQGGKATTQAGTAKTGTKAKAGTKQQTNANKAIVNKTNVKKNTNVNVNKNVNVNRDVDVHVYHGKRVHAGVYAWPRGYAYGRRPVGYILPPPFMTTPITTPATARSASSSRPATDGCVTATISCLWMCQQDAWSTSATASSTRLECGKYNPD